MKGCRISEASRNLEDNDYIIYLERSRYCIEIKVSVGGGELDSPFLVDRKLTKSVN